MIQASFDFAKGLQLDLDYRYVSALPGQLVPEYSTGDARLAWRANRQFELSFIGRNLLQPAHPEYGGDLGGLVGIKRSAYVEVRWMK
jgi:iron complex outermembrane receptor protein